MCNSNSEGKCEEEVCKRKGKKHRGDEEKATDEKIGEGGGTEQEKAEAEEVGCLLLVFCTPQISPLVSSWGRRRRRSGRGEKEKQEAENDDITRQLFCKFSVKGSAES